MVVYDCPLPSRRKCLCNMPQDAGHASCRCAMIYASEFASVFWRAIEISRLLILLCLSTLCSTAFGDILQQNDYSTHHIYHIYRWYILNEHYACMFHPSDEWMGLLEDRCVRFVHMLLKHKNKLFGPSHYFIVSLIMQRSISEKISLCTWVVHALSTHIKTEL